MRNKLIILAIVLILLLGASSAYAAMQEPQWITGEKLVGVFGVSNGDALIISSQYNQIIFTYQYADMNKPTLIDYRTYPFKDSFDQIQASVCGRVAHVVTHSAQGNGLYSIAWTLPISDTHITYLPLIVCGATWPNN